MDTRVLPLVLHPAFVLRYHTDFGTEAVIYVEASSEGNAMEQRR